MTKRDAGEEFLSGLRVDDESELNSDCSLDNSNHSGYSEGASLFDELSLTSRDVEDIYGQVTSRPDEDSDDNEDELGGNTGPREAANTLSEAENCAGAVLANLNAYTHPNQPSSHIPPVHPSEIRWCDQLAQEATRYAPISSFPSNETSEIERTSPSTGTGSSPARRGSSGGTTSPSRRTGSRPPFDNRSPPEEGPTADSLGEALSGGEEHGVLSG